MACLMEKNVKDKEKEKSQKYKVLKEEIELMFPKFRVEVIPMIVGCLGGINSADKNIQRILQCEERKAHEVRCEMQRATLFGTGQIWRRVAGQGRT